MAAGGTQVLASSHREAPFITQMPKVDGTDLYMFNSYEAGRTGYVTLLANYYPLQEPGGGPNYFTMDPNALYEIHVDNNGDAKEDITFQFKFQNTLKALKVPVGDKMVDVPLANIGPVTAMDQTALNVVESYTLNVVRGGRRTGTPMPVTNMVGGSGVFEKPADYIGTKSFPDYAAYAATHMYDVTIPGCTGAARVFVGQRAEGFAVNVGMIFDLVHAPPAVVVGGGTLPGRSLVENPLGTKNITTLALEVPTACLVATGKTIIGAWTTASVRQGRAINPKGSYDVPAKEGGAWAQVSRLANPLVNEVVIGLKDKNLFNSSEPKDDAQFATYVTNPSLAKLLEVLFGSAGVMAPTKFPRADLVAAFLTGVDGVNKDGSTADIMRLNTALPATLTAQNNLGAAGCFKLGVLDTTLVGCDPAGFPNGRRPGDDVVDIELRVMMGYLLGAADAPSGQLPFTDAVLQDASQFDVKFPYLKTPHPGASGPTM